MFKIKFGHLKIFCFTRLIRTTLTEYDEKISYAEVIAIFTKKKQEELKELKYIAQSSLSLPLVVCSSYDTAWNYNGYYVLIIGCSFRFLCSMKTYNRVKCTVNKRETECRKTYTIKATLLPNLLACQSVGLPIAMLV